MKARENPFRTERLEQLAFRLPVSSGQVSWSKLEALHYRAAIVGPHGTGKSTLMREVALRLAARGLEPIHWFVAEDRPRPPIAELCREARRLSAQQVLLFDGGGHLGRVAWSRFQRASRSAGGVLITDHAPGRLPTWVETVADPVLLEKLTAELVGSPVGVDARLLEELRERSAGNVREVFLSLYDLAARDDERLGHLLLRA